jgi:diguanylate cyclase (GGDEF)-like protein/PAS domain S-box-containing protein
MRALPVYSRLAPIAAISVGVSMLLGLAGWPPGARSLEFSGLVLAAVLIAAFAKYADSDDPALMPASFVINFTCLLLFGPEPTLVAVTAAIVTRELTDSQRLHSYRRMMVDAAIAGLAVEAAGAAHRAAGGTIGHLVWPWQAVPIAAALLTYYLLKSAGIELAAAIARTRSLGRAWIGRALSGLPNYVIGAALAAGFVELIDHRMWVILPVAAIPLYFAYNAYCDYASRLEQDHRRRDVIGSLEQGMSVVDGGGLVTLWNDVLERILDCPRERALGRTLTAAVPALGKTELPRAISEALKTRASRTIASLLLTSPAGARVLEVKILPVAAGVTVLWQDVTERRREEQALRRSEERFALAADGSSDGLWEWDLRSQELYVSSRWRALMGVAAPGGIGRAEEWFDRVHAEDIGPLKEALDAHLAGKTELFQHEHRVRREDGEYRRFVSRGVAVRGAGRRASRIAGSLTDTTERAIAQERLRSAGFVDPLTGLCNRAVFVERLGRRLDGFKQMVGGRFALLYLDLDRFKIINDSLGHLVGDELLIAVSRRLESCLREGDALARLGGDEFAILLDGVGDEPQANAIAFRIQEALAASISIGGREVFTSASIGIALGSTRYTTPDEIMRDADAAMYHAKARGKSRHELFDADMHERARDRLGLESDLRHAITNNDFEVHYQPIVLLGTGMCVGFESLVRWTRNGEPISPVTFVPLAEELGLIEPLGTWVMREACRTFAGWQKRFPDGGLDYITVNVSSRQLMQQNFLNVVETAIQESGLNPCDLRIEITETALMDSPHVAAEVLCELRGLGVKIYLDDFGTGYSSLSHLHKLPVDALKIDRSFVKSLLLPDRPAIVESILALARTLNTSLVAEGIESDVQARELERLGCTHAQGFLFSRPLSTRSAEALIEANQPLGPKQVKVSDPVAAALDQSQFYHSSAPIDWSKDLPA